MRRSKSPGSLRYPYVIAAALTLVAAAGLTVFAQQATTYYVVEPLSTLDLSRSVELPGALPRDRFIVTSIKLVPANYYDALVESLTDGDLLSDWDAQGHDRGSQEEVQRGNAVLLHDSERAATVIAERAAGLEDLRARLEPVVWGRLWPQSSPLLAGDVILEMAGKRVRSCADYDRAYQGRLPDRVLFRVRRGDAVRTVVTSMMDTDLWCTDAVAPGASVNQPRFDIQREFGASAGLALALRMYESLRPRRNNIGARIIGVSGALSLDGRIHEVGGIRSKVRAAENAGARIFVLPRENYDEVAEAHKIQLVPVSSFREAVVALGL